MTGSGRDDERPVCSPPCPDKSAARLEIRGVGRVTGTRQLCLRRLLTPSGFDFAAVNVISVPHSGKRPLRPWLSSIFVT